MTIVSTTSGSASGSGWIKVAEYPQGFNYSNCIAISYTVFADGYGFSTRDGLSVATKSDGLYCAVSNAAFTSKPLKIALGKTD